jgi:hypothetical protein
VPVTSNRQQQQQKAAAPWQACGRGLPQVGVRGVGRVVGQSRAG